MKKMNLGIRFILGFVSVILCILLVVTTLAAAILGDLNAVFQKDNLQQLLKESLFSSATTRQSAPAISGNGQGRPAVQRFPARLDDFDLTTGIGGDTSAMVEWIYGTLTDQLGEENLPALEEVKDFVEESTLTDFLTDKTASIISDVVTGSSNTTITTEEIQTLLEDNAQLVEDTFGLEMNEEIIEQVVEVVEQNEIVQAIQKEGVTKVVEDMVESGALELPTEILPLPILPGSPDKNPSETPTVNPVMELLQTVQSIVSVSTLMMAIGACVVLIALQMVTNMKRIWIGINNTGISLTVAGSILMIPTCLLWFASDLLDQLLQGAGPVGKIVLYVLNSTAPIHIGIFAGGILLIIGGCVLRTVLKRKAMAAAEILTIEEAPLEEAAAETEIAAEEPVAEEVDASVEEEAPVEEVPAEETPADPV